MGHRKKSFNFGGNLNHHTNVCIIIINIIIMITTIIITLFYG